MHSDSSIIAAEWSSKDYATSLFVIRQKQNQLIKLGILKMIFKLVKQKLNYQLIEEIILLCIALLVGGNENVQNAFLEQMMQNENNEFLVLLKHQINLNFSQVQKEMMAFNKKLRQDFIR